MAKFQVGDNVKCELSKDYFEKFPHNRKFIKQQETKGVITYVKGREYYINNWWWPESALTLVEDGKVDDKFQWTDELVKKLLRNITAYEAPEHWDKEVEDFKKKKEEQKPTVVDHQYDKSSFSFVINNPDRKDYIISRIRLGEILIAEEQGKLKID